jgi:hypothetical protein
MIRLAVLLAVLQCMAWTGCAPASEGWSPGESAFRETDFDLREEDFGRIAEGNLPFMVADLMTGQPLVGASVWTVDRVAFVHSLRIGGKRGFVSLPPAHAALTDERGIGWIPAPQDIAFVMASVPGFGVHERPFFHLESHEAAARCGKVAMVSTIDTSGMRLQVQPALDAIGLPLPVFLRSTENEIRLPFPRVPDSPDVFLSPGYLMDTSFPFDEDPFAGLRLVPGFCEEAAVPFTAEIFRGKKTKLRPPPTGQMQVRLLDDAGAEVTQPTAVAFEEVGLPWSLRSHHMADENFAGVAEGGSLLLRGIPLGKRWRIGYWIEGVLGMVTTEMDGPVSAGQTLSAEVDPTFRCSMLTAQLRAPDGGLLADRPVSVTIEGRVGESEISDYMRWRTDSEGFIQIICVPPPGGSWSSLQFKFAGDKQDPPFETKELSIPESGDLGEPTTWLPDDLLAWGVVEDAVTGEWASARLGLPGEMHAHTAADGSFEYSNRDLEAGTPFEFLAAGPWHLPGRARSEAQDRKVNVSLQRGSRVHGRLLLPNSTFTYRVTIEALGAQSLEPEREAVRSEFDAFSRHGWFDCGPFPSGTWDLRVRVGGMVVAEAPAADLIAGELLRDPRLAAIDLRDHTQTFVTVAITEGHGEPERIFVMVEMPDGQRLMAQKGHLLIPPGALRVGAMAPGFKEAWMPVQSGDVKILLEKE